MAKLCLILGDQLSQAISSIQNFDIKNDVVLMCEVQEEATYVKHHKKKIAFIFAAMRHFSEELKSKNCNVRYVKLDDKNNAGSFEAEVARAVNDLKISHVCITEPSEYRLLSQMQQWQKKLGIKVDILNDDRFLATHEEFANLAKGKRQYRMEFFYREMRRKYNILLDKAGQPEGGSWNYDKENRKPPVAGLKSPKRIAHKKSAILKDVLKLVDEKFNSHFGTLEPFNYAVTREQALLELDHFIAELLPKFGDYQDAMVANEPYLYHSLISSYLNVGLILPLEICKKAEDAYKNGTAPLNAVEGFIRQILGWREYIRGVYWYFMPEYGERNHLNANTNLPEFYWSAETKMFCMAEAIRHTRDHAYSHHIQRLMLTGNFALIAGLDVKQVQEWYLAVYSDAFEWVEMPNTLGMALFGDGGIVASKPYAASGKYISRMSNYCKKCYYDPEIMIGERACPFNALYWNFLVKHESEFKANQRMPYIYSTWAKFGAEKQNAIKAQAQKHLKNMAEGNL